MAKQTENPMEYDENDPRHHAHRLRQMLNDTITDARDDVLKVSDPKAQALFETTAEVLNGLVKALDDFEQKSETAWQEPQTQAEKGDRFPKLGNSIF